MTHPRRLGNCDRFDYPPFAMSSKKPPLPRPTAHEAYRYVSRYVQVLALTFGGIAVALLAYNLYTSGVAEDAAALLADDEPSADDLKAAFEMLEPSHLFSGWRVPDALWTDDDPLLGGVDEEELVEAVIALDAPLAPTAQSTPPESCDSADLICLATGLGRPLEPSLKQVPQAYKVYRYLLLRRSMARGEALSAERLAFFQWNRTLWVRAFRRQVMDADGTPTASDATLLRELREILAASSKNGLIFAWYGIASALIFALILFFWRRLHGPKDGGEPRV